MKVLGIDFGTKTIGLALSDPSQKIAFPFENVPAHLALKRIQALLTEDEIEGIVMGKPTNMKGQDTPMTLQAAEFKNKLSNLVTIPIFEQDERLTSKMADRSFATMGVSTRDRRPMKDASEAALMLQGFLDKKHAPH